MPGNSPCGNSPRSPFPLCPPPDVDALDCPPGWLEPGAPDWLALPCCPPVELELWVPLCELLDALLSEELLLDELLDELLLEELLDELLLDELLEELLLDGELALGTEGVCGWVGLLELGQPARSRHSTAMLPLAARRWLISVLDNIGPEYVFSRHRLPLFKPGPEGCFAQFAHQAVGPPLVDLVLVDPLEVQNATARVDSEF